MTNKNFDPYSVTLILTGDQNFFLAKSSNGYDVYGVVFEGENRVICSCLGFENGYNCRHRKALMARYGYVRELDEVMSDEVWEAVKTRIEAAAELEAFNELFEEAA